MNKIISITLIILSVLLTVSCKKEQPSTEIITHKPVEEAPKPTQKTGDYDQTMDANWLGTTYKVVTVCEADETLPLVSDENGNKFYDNKVRVSVVRNDGSTFFTRTFMKSDFLPYADNLKESKNALLGVVLDKAEGDYIYLVGSVGSPDEMSDEYVLFEIQLSRYGKVVIKRSTRLEMESGAAESDDGV